MIESILIFGLALLIIILAQFGERKAWAQWLTYLLLFLAGLLLVAAGLAALISPQLINQLAPGIHSSKFAWVLMGAGLLIIAPALLATIAPRRGLPWTRPVHLTAWTLLVLFIGSNFAVVALKDLSSIEIDDALTMVLIQNAAFALAALLGVGWGVRRNWRETLSRLGLSRPTLHDFLIGAGMALLMLMITGVMGAVVALIFGDDMGDASGFNQQIISQLPGAGGVLLMGLATGIGEEMLYRGAIQPVAGVWITSFLFAISHIQYLSPAIIVIFTLGMMLGYTRIKWGLNTAICSHAVYNTLVGLLALLAMNFT